MPRHLPPPPRPGRRARHQGPRAATGRETLTITREAEALKAVLSDIALFSRLVIGLPLRPYQLAPLRAILDSVVHRRGLAFLLIFPRQSGKNEAAAQLLVYLLNLYQRRGGAIVFGAAGDGLGRGLRRLDQRLDNPLNAKHWTRSGRPLSRSLGRAHVAFLSTHPQTAARGETAGLLLVIDELQDQDPVHLEAVFEPMRAANNATALYLGTVRTTADALWRKKAELEALQNQDGVRRVFLVTPDQVSRDNPDYQAFLAAKIAALGRRHPVIASEYFNEPLDAHGGLFDDRRLRLMRGHHPRQAGPTPGRIYVATLDVAGEDEAATDPLAALARPARDYTAATTFELVPGPPDSPGPRCQAVDLFLDHGGRHFQDAPGHPSLARRLAAWLDHWRVSHLIADSTGVGQGLTSWLANHLGSSRVTPFTFTAPAKAALGAAFLALIETGRFAYFAQQTEFDDAWWFFAQARACTYFLPPAGRLERDLRWEVPASARIATPTGNQPVHDDRLISAALIAIFDQLHAAGRLRTGHGRSVIIPPRFDPDGPIY